MPSPGKCRRDSFQETAQRVLRRPLQVLVIDLVLRPLSVGRPRRRRAASPGAWLGPFRARTPDVDRVHVLGHVRPHARRRPARNDGLPPTAVPSRRRRCPRARPPMREPAGRTRRRRSARVLVIVNWVASRAGWRTDASERWAGGAEVDGRRHAHDLRVVSATRDSTNVLRVHPLGTIVELSAAAGRGHLALGVVVHGTSQGHLRLGSDPLQRSDSARSPARRGSRPEWRSRRREDRGRPAG